MRVSMKKIGEEMAQLLSVVSAKWNLPINMRQTEALVKHYRGWVYACVDRNSKAVSSIPIRLYKKIPEEEKPKHYVKVRGGLVRVNTKTYDSYLENRNISSYISKGMEIEEVTQHPLIDLLRQVNPFANEDDLLYGTEAYLQMIGNAYWYLVPSRMPSLSIAGRKLPKEIWMVQSQYCHPVPDKKQFISGYKMEINGKKQYFSPEEIIHFKLFNPGSMIEGMGPLQAAAYAVDIDEAKKRYTFSFFKNSAIPPYFFSLPFDAEKMKGPVWTRKQWRKFKRQFLEQHEGPDKAAKVARLQGGLDITQIGGSPKDFTFLLMTKPTVEEMAAIFGIPLFKLTGEGVDKLNAQLADYSYQRDTIRPLLKNIEQKLNEQLTPLYDPKLFLVFENNIPDDQAFRLKEHGDLVDKVLTKNEVRQARGLPPVEGGDLLYVPANSIAIGATPDPNKGKVSISGVVKRLKAHIHKEQITPEMEKIAAKLTPSLATVFNDYHNTVLRRVDDYPDGGPADWVTESDAETQIKELLTRSGVLVSEFQRVGQEAMEQVTKNATARTKEDAPQIRFDVEATGAAEQIDKLIEGFSVYPIATTMEELRATLEDGMKAGEAILGLKKRISKVFGVMGADEGVISSTGVTRRNWRILRIARTEAARAYNYGHLEGWRQTGLVKAKVWTTGANPCELCDGLQGTTMPLDDSFDGKITELAPSFDFSYGEVLAPPLHPSCGCQLIPVTL